MTETIQLLENHIRNLPLNMQKAIASIDIREPLSEIVKKHNLMLDQAGALETETIIILTGMEPGEEFVDNIVREVRVPSNVAIEIAKDVDNLIFSQVRKHLQEPTESSEEDTLPEREALLKEIEGSPKTNTAPQTASDPKEAPKPKSSSRFTETDMMGEAENTGSESDPEAPDGSGVDSIVSSRLSTPSAEKHEKKNMEENRREAVKRDYPEGSDPYRELPE